MYLKKKNKCLKILQNQVGDRVTTIQGDAVTYCQKGQYDVVTSSFAHDHISYDRAVSFVKNIHRNLKKGGLYVMGGEILPPYSTEDERKEALLAYHGFIVSKALREGHYTLAQIEINALKSGIERIGDFKRHEVAFEKEMLSMPFELVQKTKLGPEIPNDVGGVFVYVYKAL